MIYRFIINIIMTSHKVNWDKVKELGIQIKPKITIEVKSKKTKKIKYIRNHSTIRYKWSDGQLLKYNIKNSTYTIG
jgi:hypothetical protein